MRDIRAVPCCCRAIIVEECMRTGGIGASLSAVIHETLFNDLDHEVSYSHLLLYTCLRCCPPGSQLMTDQFRTSSTLACLLLSGSSIGPSAAL